MTSASNNSGICSYTYADNGLLKTRQTPLATTSIERDNVGRVMGERMNNNAGSLLFNESMQYQLNGQLKNYSVLDNGLGVPAESRAYVYDQCGRVVQEPYLFNGQQTAQYFFDGSPLGTLNSTTDGLGIRTLQFVNSTTFNGVMAQNSFLQSTNDKVCMMPQYNGSYPWSLSYDELGEITSRSPGIFTQSFTWDSFGCLAKIAQKGNNSDYTWSTIYDGLGRRIQTGLQGNTSGNSSTINYYYDPEVEFLELGHDNNGRTWNLYGPDRSGTYGGAQGIGGLEVTWQLSGDVINGILNNYFGDSLGTINSSGTPTPYNGVLCGYGPMPGYSFPGYLDPFTQQWRGHYLDWTGFYYMGARYYEPNSGRFLSPDPLGHDASLSLYDYCNGDPVNALDADGRCVEKLESTVPGNAAWQQSMANFSSGNYGTAALDFTAMIGEQAFAAATWGIGSAATVGVEGAASVATEAIGSAEVGVTETEIVNQTKTIQPYFPPNNGFIGTTENQFLMNGDKISRYGGSGYSRFFSPVETSEAARALPTGSAGQPLRTFEVVKPFEIEQGTVAPAFGQPGFGQQFVSPVKLDILLRRGIMKEITPSI